MGQSNNYKKHHTVERRSGRSAAALPLDTAGAGPQGPGGANPDSPASATAPGREIKNVGHRRALSQASGVAGESGTSPVT